MYLLQASLTDEISQPRGRSPEYLQNTNKVLAMECKPAICGKLLLESSLVPILHLFFLSFWCRLLQYYLVERGLYLSFGGPQELL